MPTGSAVGCLVRQHGAEVGQVGEFGHHLVVGQGETVGGVEVYGASNGDLPAGAAQVSGHLGALTLVDEVGPVDVHAVSPPALGEVGHAVVVSEDAEIGNVFGGQLAAGGTERSDVVEEAVLGLRRQVHQQPLGAPRRGLARV